MNIDIWELLVFDVTVNHLAKQYNLPPNIAAFRLFNDIKDYKIDGLKKEVSRLSQQVSVVNRVWANHAANSTTTTTKHSRLISMHSNYNNIKIS